MPGECPVIGSRLLSDNATTLRISACSLELHYYCCLICEDRRLAPTNSSPATVFNATCCSWWYRSSPEVLERLHSSWLEALAYLVLN